MKYILILAFIFLSLEAQIETKQMYAQVTSKTADLYNIPTKYGDKKLNYFKKGDMLPVEYCDKSSWCKVSNGYIQKKLLLIPEPILKNVVAMPKYKTELIKEVENKSKVVSAPTAISKQRVVLSDKDTSKPQMYANINSKNADLYNIPNLDAEKKVNYFKEGDTIPIVYCDKSMWCKTNNGYVKKDFLTPLESAHFQKIETITPNSLEVKEVPVVVEKNNKLHDNNLIYAKLLSDKANLYYKPRFNAKQSVDYFQKGDRVKIDYCDSDTWCKTINGYVRQDDIIMSKSLMQEARANYGLEPVRYVENKKIIPHKVVVPKRELTYLEDQMIITKTKYIRIVEDIGEYEEYFKNDSAKVIFNEKK